MLSIKGLNKAEVLRDLYNRSKVQGMGFLQATGRDMTLCEAAGILEAGNTYFDYLYGKVMKVDLSGDEFEERLYDRDIGSGVAKKVIDAIRSRNNVN